MSEYVQNKDFRLKRMIKIVEELKKGATVDSLIEKHIDFY